MNSPITLHLVPTIENIKMAIFFVILFFIVDTLVYYGGMKLYRNLTGASKREAKEQFAGIGKMTATIIIIMMVSIKYL